MPHALYVDNGSIYSSKEILQICVRVGCLLHHTPVHDGAAKGKVEKNFRTVRDQFLARDLDLSSLEALNRQFIQWVEEQYNAPGRWNVWWSITKVNAWAKPACLIPSPTTANRSTRQPKFNL